MNLLGRNWKYNGRTFPLDAKLKVLNIHVKWDDLMWFNEVNGYWTYISTLPHIEFPSVCSEGK